ncbi:MAG: M12 family metallo-peptidase [Flavobacterium sp.]|nr:M12 family metallo-peptidase [Flavobacterium sp.]
MKNKLLLTVLLLSTISICAQKRTLIEQELAHHKEMGEFKKSSPDIFHNPRQFITAEGRYIQLIINSDEVESIIKNKNKFISINIPFSETETKRLLLKKRELFTEDSKIIEERANGKIKIQTPDFVTYSGVIDDKGGENSIASITFIDNTMRGIISIGNKEYTIVPKNDNGGRDEYLLYEKSEIKLKSFNASCSFDDKNTIVLPDQNTEMATIPKCVTVHFEISYIKINEWNGSSESVANLLFLFNQVQSIYANENITMRMSSLKLWMRSDPYLEDNRDEGLSAFNINSGDFDGNIGCLLNGLYQGGIAFLGNIGNCRRVAVCGMDNAAVAFPDYSWDVNVIAHELGHTLGSHHTHWCGWNGGAIDNCATTEGGCPPGPMPVNGGTIMSYCHLNTGINFNNGFGSQPSAVIQNQINTDECIISCQTAQSCEDNVVSNVQLDDNGQDYTVTWTSSYPVKVYRRENPALDFTYVSTVANITSSITLDYITDCSVEKTEVKLISECPNGDSKPTVIEISPIGKNPSLNFSGTLNMCEDYQNDERLLTVQHFNAYNSFQWKYNSNLIDGANDYNYTANQLGAYSCLVTTSSGCNYETNILSLTEELPTSGFSYQKSGLNTTFTNEASCSHQQAWSFGDGINSTDDSPTHHYLVANYYNACISSTNLAGSNQFCKSIPVFDKWVDNMNNSTDGTSYNVTYDDSQCDRSVRFTRNNSSDYSQNTYIQYPFEDWIPKQGTLEFLIKVSNGSTFNGISNTTASIFSVGNQSYTNSSFLSVFSNGKITLRRYQSPGFTDVTALGTPFTFNQWHVVSVSYGSTGTSIAVDGTVYVTNTSANFNMNTGIVTLGHISFESFENLWYGFEGLVDKFRISYTQNDFQLTPDGNLITPMITQVGNVLYSSSPENNQWYLNGIAISNATNQSLEILGDGIYKVELSSPFGCNSAFSTDYIIAPLSTTENEMESITVYPNPFGNSITVSSSNDLIKSVTVFDLLGREVKLSNAVNTKEIRLNLDSLCESVYILEVVSDKSIRRIKVIKKY